MCPIRWRKCPIWSRRKKKGGSGIFRGVGRDALLSFGGAGKGDRAAAFGLGIRKYGVRELTVNEQNPNAVDFYTRMGFVPYKRTETDEEGGPSPFRYMRL